MQRRVFVKLSAFTATVLTLPFAPGCKPGALDAESQPLFFSHLVDAKTITEAGKAYLVVRPDENDIDKLKNLILSKNRPSTDPKEISLALESWIRNDFNTGNTVTVSGWVLSATEARQCALFYLLKS